MFDDDEEEGTALLHASELVVPAISQALPFLVFLVGDSPGRMLRLDGDTVCGRGADCDLRLTGEGVSRRHTRFWQQDGITWVADLGSTNGTMVNGVRITGDHRLADGDKIQIGATFLLKFSLQDELEQRMQQGMLDAALRDPLTGAHNRRAMVERLEADLAHAKRHAHPYTVALLDLDHFKQINDRFGHLAGDAVLKRFAQLVESQVRREDFFARYGGEEFAVGCRSTDLTAARVVLERVRMATAAEVFEFDGQRIPVTVSIGAAAARDGEGPTELLAAADAALYEAKGGGRNRVCVRA